MTKDELQLIISTLTNAYPQVEFTEDMGALYSRALVGQDFDAVWGNLERHITESEWFPTLTELMDEIIKPPAEPRATDHCDGTGFIVDDEDLSTRRPCPRCQPYHYDVWLDPERWHRYSNGTPLEELHDLLKLVTVRNKAVLVTTDGRSMPLRCKVETRYDEIVPVERAQQLLAEGVAAGRAEQRAKMEARGGDVHARYLWWQSGAKGHYPGCHCKQCQAGHVSRDAGPSPDHKLAGGKPSSSPPAHEPVPPRQPSGPVPVQADIQDPAAKDFLEAARRLGRELEDEEPI